MEQQLKELNEMQSNLKVIVNSHENNMIKLGYEVWRQIDGYNNYSVSSFGRVKNDNTERILKPGIGNQNGYNTVSLSKHQHKVKPFYVHKLVANAFIPNPYNKLTMC